jgi:L-fuconolactonase
MLKPAFMRGIEALNEFGYTYDILIFPDQLKYIRDFVTAFPNQMFVLDHIAKPYIKDKKIDEWKKDMQAVAEFDNVFCKISGMVTEAHFKNWKKEDFTPYIDVVVKAFGIDRIMYGSDWPVCLVGGSYEKVLDIVQEYFQSYSKEDQVKIFKTNATKFYKL